MFRFSNKRALGQGLKCRVQHLVPGEELEVSYGANSTGQDLLNDVAQQLDLLDKDYYGLKLYDHIQWLDLTKSVVKQTKGLGPAVVLVLRFKYYPAEPALLANESTRYFLYLQLRADLLEGRLRSESSDTLAYLIACVLQSEMGDASSSSSPAAGASSTKRSLASQSQSQQPQQQQQDNYVAEYKFVPNQSEELELASIRLHQSEDFLGLRPAHAELNFLKKACQLEAYGVDPYPVKDDSSRNHFLIGVNHRGILTFQDSRLTNLFIWDEIDRIELDGKLVLVYCHKIERKIDKIIKRRSMFACRCPTQDLARAFWKVATEHKYFFTLDTTPDRPIVANTGGFLKKSHKLKYVGRVEKDLLRDRVDELRASGGVKRSRSLMAKASNGPLWQGFGRGPANQSQQQQQAQQQQKRLAGNATLQSSMGDLYSSDAINRTIPASMNYFREDDEAEEDDDAAAVVGNEDGRAREQGTRQADSSAKPAFSRKSALTTKSEAASSGASAIRRGSQVYMDTQQNDRDFARASLLLLLIFVAIFITILLIGDADRPHSVTLLVKRLHLEHVSQSMRHNYYLPLKSALSASLGRLVAILDSRLL